jgi:hypothetical protein
MTSTYGSAVSDFWIGTDLNSPSSGQTFVRQSCGGQTSRQIACRQGGVSAIYQIYGGVIPASGPVTVIIPYGYEPITDNCPSISVTGFLGDVPGVLSASWVIPVTVAIATYKFTRSSSGSAITMASATFRALPYLQNCPQLIWMGTNDYTGLNSTITKENIKASYDLCTDPQKRVFILTICRANWIPAASVSIVNEWIRSEYPKNCVDVSQALADANDGSEGDLEDVSNGVIPRSLRFDTLHLNVAGKRIVSQEIKKKKIENGW